MRKCFSAIAAAAMLTAAALAGPVAAADGDNAEAHVGSFKIVQLWSNDRERFEREWAQPTPPNLTTNSRFDRNQVAHQFIIFANCQVDAAGNCRLSATVDLVAPDGTAYGERIAFPLWDNQPAPPRDRLVLGAASIAVRVEDGEQLGDYRAILAVTDENAGVTATSRVTLTVGEAAGSPQS